MLLRSRLIPYFLISFSEIFLPPENSATHDMQTTSDASVDKSARQSDGSP